MTDETAYDDETTTLTGKEGAVRAWRFEQFCRLGFATGTALRLVDSPADLGVARRLIGLGCPVATAGAILE